MSIQFETVNEYRIWRENTKVCVIRDVTKFEKSITQTLCSFINVTWHDQKESRPVKIRRNQNCAEWGPICITFRHPARKPRNWIYHHRHGIKYPWNVWDQINFWNFPPFLTWIANYKWSVRHHRKLRQINTNNFSAVNFEKRVI